MSKLAKPSQPASHSNFIRQRIEADLASGKVKAIKTRFPPEPNGYLHLGHAKSILLNFGLAKEYGGTCNLRFDDTNPEKEEQEYVDSIIESVKWLVPEFDGKALYASDYFDFMYQCAEYLVTSGNAYVDSQSADDMKRNRGDFTHPGVDSPYRSRSAEENLALLREMRDGKHADGAHVLRAKISMASPNINMRDPALYRIKRATHHRTGDKWCIYPMYTYAHPIEDAVEGITHSLCTLEFEDQRPFYDWLLNKLADGGLLTRPLPQQIEFARLQLTNVMLSKRLLIKLVQDGVVDGWDDPRMPTLAGARRRGYTPEGFRRFAERVGVSKENSVIGYSVLEDCMREHLDEVTMRKFAVLDPLKLVIENYPEGQEDLIEAPNHPKVTKLGKRHMPFTRELWIEREDYQETPTKDFTRLSPGSNVRLRFAYVVECIGYDKASDTVRCKYFPSTRSGTAGADSVKVSGNIHWVSAKHFHEADVRIYEHLFDVEMPQGVNDLVRTSKTIRRAKMEVSLKAAPTHPLQFERHGYFVHHSNGFTRTVNLRDASSKGPALEQKTMPYSIDNFWVQRLGKDSHVSLAKTLRGWSIESQRNPSFVEADLALRKDFSNLQAPIWLVAAPGAVGKSTLAKEISARTGAVYVDLARADSVGGYSLTGGLVQGGLIDKWQSENLAVLLDALDEARLRVTQNAYFDFLKDLVSLTTNHKKPLVLFGRVGIVEETWLNLAELGLNCPVFDIGFFDASRSEQFVLAVLRRMAKDDDYTDLRSGLTSHEPVYRQAIQQFLRGLKEVAKTDGVRFSGYAPVLEAVAKALAGVSNPASLKETVGAVLKGQILQALTSSILVRESGKLRRQLEDNFTSDLLGTLYTPEEQLSRLASRVFGTPQSAIRIPRLPTELISLYEAAVASFMEQHPFLDGNNRSPSSAVFGAAIVAHALLSQERPLVTAAEKYSGDGPQTPNPFLTDFYIAKTGSRSDGGTEAPPEHIVLLYESIRAASTFGETVSLSVEGTEDSEDVDVEIQSSSRRVLIRSSQAGALRFNRQINNVSIDAPNIDVIIGTGYPVEIVSPVFMNVERIEFNCPEITVIRGDQIQSGEDGSVVLEAREEARSITLTKAPTVHTGAELAVTWPNSNSYPWSSFSSSSESSYSGDLYESMRRLRRLVLAFRSHGKGQLARYRGMIEHSRVAKGVLGERIRARLLKDKVLSASGHLYFLNSSALGRVVGATYQELKLNRLNDRVRAYLSALSND